VADVVLDVGSVDKGKVDGPGHVGRGHNLKLFSIHN
jgi:hypothetical protein